MNKEEREAPEFKNKNVNGKYPLLELESGELICEASAVANHLAREAPASGLMGKTPFQTA